MRFKCVLLTSAVGQLGQEMRPRLAACCQALGLSRRKDFGAAGKGEEITLAVL
jgi:uronate dehydrogenase